MTLHEDAGSEVVVGAVLVVVVAGGDVTVVEEAMVVTVVLGRSSVVLVVWAAVVVVVVRSAANTGASTLSGEAGRSLTRSSAALTICQVRVVVRNRTRVHPAMRLKRRTRSLSQTSRPGVVNEPSRFS